MIKTFKNLLICPSCKRDLNAPSNRNFECENCKAHYPIINDIPVFLPKKVQTKNMRERQEFWDKGWQKRLEGGDQTWFTKLSASEAVKYLHQKIEWLRHVNDILVKEACPKNVKGKTLLDIGCGQGTQAAILTSYGAKYIGIDFSYIAAKYSNEAIKKLNANGITLQADAESLPLKNESIDFVFSSGVLHHTPNTNIAFDEIYRVLKKGGKAAIALYYTYSPVFISGKILGFIKMCITSNKKWFNQGEAAWKTKGRVNPWTKTYSKKELTKMLVKYSISDLYFRTYAFSWGNVFPYLGRYVDRNKLGQQISYYLSKKVGSMLVTYFVKI